MIFVWIALLVLSSFCVELFINPSQLLEKYNLQFPDLSKIHSGHHNRFKKGEWAIDYTQKWRNTRYYYRISHVEEKSVNGLALDVADCRKCVEDICPIPQQYVPQVTIKEEGEIKIPIEILRLLTRDDVSPSANVPQIQLELCIPLGTWSWPWEDADYDCSKFHVYQRAPITSKYNASLSDGFFRLRKCDPK